MGRRIPLARPDSTCRTMSRFLRTSSVTLRTVRCRNRSKDSSSPQPLRRSKPRKRSGSTGTTSSRPARPRTFDSVSSKTAAGYLIKISSSTLTREPISFDVQLPSFLPSGIPIVVSIEAEALRWETGSNGLYVFRQTVILGTPILRPTNLDPWILLACLAFLVAILVVARPRRRPPMAEGRTSDEDKPVHEPPKVGTDSRPPRK